MGWSFSVLFFSPIYYSFSLLSLRFIFFMVVENSLRCVEVVLVTHIPLHSLSFKLMNEDRAHLISSAKFHYPFRTPTTQHFTITTPIIIHSVCQTCPPLPPPSSSTPPKTTV